MRGRCFFGTRAADSRRSDVESPRCRSFVVEAPSVAEARDWRDAIDRLRPLAVARRADALGAVERRERAAPLRAEIDRRFRGSPAKRRNSRARSHRSRFG